ncbi:ExbD/TolR family protein [Bartonella sp. HY329]|uniref:ExbD/TolR family protein n=1 Tax=unclassified Bartonella TaxID=2645622 RepID=UPI0021C8ABC7|nr:MULTISPECIES: ExbD/TolR family protein [unclassified Bartonella]UXM94795.1 ExbD/TolR family protein [Bartonella sp. HY329]UXN09118.1 ExbD/TolR family protein [Bartonella sp. HY328]
MAMSVGGSGSGHGRRGRRRGGKRALMSEINVTPMVDVMLVLLIIFMVSAPLLINGVPMDLPKSGAGPISAQKEPITVSVTADGRYAIKKEFYPRDQITQRLKAIGGVSSEGLGQRIVVQGERNANYETVLDLIDLIQKAGFSNIALASSPSNSGR